LETFCIKSGIVVAENYAASRKVAGLRPDAVNAVFQIYLILSASLGPGVCSDLKKNENQKPKNISGE
jgi:hypothetical protein